MPDVSGATELMMWEGLGYAQFPLVTFDYLLFPSPSPSSWFPVVGIDQSCKDPVLVLLHVREDPTGWVGD